ncbi:MAG: hypothetical protein CL482_09335 [Acidobacteria bacterium]|nr:hypothetical protein [Acidobacteriota bacterium]
MAVSEELTRFVRDGLSHGATRGRIEEVLRGAGWALGDVQGALASYADVEFPVPVPRPQPYLSAREAFMYLLLFATLYISAFSLGQLCFQLINQMFPDPAVSPLAPELARQATRWSVAYLIVAFPIFLTLSRRVGGEVATDPAKRGSKVRRWLTYLTLFVAAAVLIGDVANLVYSLLGGELTVRFCLKVLTIGGIAGTAFWFYLSDLRRDEREEQP